jgi:serine/threonine protein kinase/tetratricopeptide (TPR) repeat protein
MALAPGSRLGPYEISRLIGAGGMGEVYRARDTRLGREVAVKVLPERVAKDPDALARFEREARTVAALNDPHVCSLHDVGSEGDVRYAVLELLEGETVRERLSRGALPPSNAVELAMQMCHGLAAAHSKGIVHRDLKPENLFLTPKGLKILDFGLAKLQPVGGGAGEAGFSKEPTRSAQEQLTSPGVAPGTAAYMSPEQARGEPAEARSDIFAAGVVLYEMLSGRRPFRRDTHPETLTAILKEDTPVLTSPTGPVPPGLERIVRRCLEKDPEHRFHSAEDVAFALEAISDRRPGITPPAPSRRRPWLRPAALAAVVVLGLAGLWLWLRPSPEPAVAPGASAPLRSLAVLPLENLSGDPEQEYFADGMTEALIADLSKIKALRVIGRTSVMQYKGVKKPLPQIASELGVDAVVEGSVMWSGDRVRITTQLVRAVPEEHLWAESYVRDLHDILALQSDVARRIAEAVEASVTPEEEKRLASTRQVDPVAHEAYLKGRHFLRLSQPRKCIDYFQEALAADPSYALAYAGLAEAYVTFAHGEIPPREAFPQGMAMATKALELDSTLSEAHTALADARYHYNYDWIGAEAGFRRVFDLDSSNATAHAWYAGLLAAQGRFDEASAEMKEVKILDPFSAHRHLAARWLYYARRPTQVIQECEERLELYPNEPDYLLGLAYAQEGRYERAISELEKALSVSGSGPYETSGLAQVYAEAGRLADARALLEELEELSEAEYVPPHLIALVYAALGQEDQAFAWLEKAYELRDAALIWANVHPGFDRLRSDSRFQDLLRRMNLAD